jgi:hypothetical protein
MASIVPTNGSPLTGGPIQTPGMGGTSNGQVPVGTAPTPGTALNPINGVQANPFAPPAVNGLPPGSVQSSPVNWVDGSNTVIGDFNDTYGKGTAGAITSVLQNLGTSTDSAVQALINNTNLEAGKQYSNIQATQAASGITPDSSTAALAAGDFYSTVNSNLQSQVAGMESNQENTLLQTLLNEGAAHGPDESTFEKIASAIPGLSSIVGSGSSAASSITSAINPGADTSILDALGALA